MIAKRVLVAPLRRQWHSSVHLALGLRYTKCPWSPGLACVSVVPSHPPSNRTPPPPHHPPLPPTSHYYKPPQSSKAARSQALSPRVYINIYNKKGAQVGKTGCEAQVPPTHHPSNTHQQHYTHPLIPPTHPPSNHPPTMFHPPTILIIGRWVVYNAPGGGWLP